MTPTMHSDNDGVIEQGHVLDVLRTMDAESVDCCITSPPYWGLRSYKTEPQIWGGKAECQHQWIETKKESTHGKGFGEKKKIISLNEDTYSDTCSFCNAWRGELGLEPDFNLYLDHIIEIFREVKRVLKKTGTLWVNLGDSYSANSTHANKSGATMYDGLMPGYGKESGRIVRSESGRFKDGLPQKTLCQIPSRFAIRMSDDGWILRNELIWFKRNCMPSSADDRFTVDFEKIFFFTKSPRYWFERQFEPQQECSIKRAFSVNHLENRKDRKDKAFAISSDAQDRAYIKMREKLKNGEEVGRNKRCVTIANMSYMKLKNNLPVATKLHIINELIKKGLL